MKYVCLVCGYDQLLEPPKNYIICPCCGTQFGYHDSGVTHQELRAEWLEDGAMWHSRRVQPPIGWNALEQLKQAGFWSESYTPSTQQVVPVRVQRERALSVAVGNSAGQITHSVQVNPSRIQSGVRVS